MLSRNARAPSGIGPPNAGLIARTTETTMPATTMPPIVPRPMGIPAIGTVIRPTR